MKKNINVCLIQSSLEWENKRANLTHFESLIRKIKNQNIIVLPEMFTTGFSMDKERLAEQWPSSYTLIWMKRMAQNTGADIVGSFIAKEDAQYFNRLSWVTPQGDVWSYDKRHLFTLAGEHNHYTAGTDRLIVERFGWRFMPLVCYDVRFPVWSRNDRSIDAMIYIANFPDKRKLAWQTLLNARAIENQTFVVGVNITGKDGKGIEYSGGSYIYDYNGDLVLDCESENTILSATLNIDDLHSYRTKFAFLQDKDEFKLL